MVETSAPLTWRDLAGIGLERLKRGNQRRVEALGELGVAQLGDLLTYYPRRYLDRSREATVGELNVGEDATVLATVNRVRSVPGRDPGPGRRRRDRVEVRVSDRDGASLKCVFFNQPWRSKQLREDMQAVLYGRLEEFRGALQMTNPVVDLVGDRTGGIFAVYPLSAKAAITTWEIADMVAEALRRCEPRGIADPVPVDLLGAHGLCGRFEALRLIHDPETFADVTRARNRLVFDELLRMQVALVGRKRDRERAGDGIAHEVDRALLAGFHRRLPFALTAAQSRTVAEILADLSQPWPMHRLLQGEVGSGKTVVALTAMLAVVGGGRQAALMAPTEVLAEQHYLGLSGLLDCLGDGDGDGDGGLAGGTGRLSLGGLAPVSLELLTGRSGARARQRILGGLASGDVNMVVGTHALISEGVAFESLGLAVVDEQHRFGVEQRAALGARAALGGLPDVLVMTATPIPRTAAMTVYGDLDVSRLDELPAGRAGVTTSAVTAPLEQPAVWERLRGEVAAGRQAYVVCPLIEESDKVAAAGAEATFEELRRGELAGLRVGMLHGRLPASAREPLMAAFRDGELDVLVATTVIEVGVDVANATVMVILGADRFGIAQLHQLRGRVGRGAAPGWCYLVAENPSPSAQARLGALVDSSDGFELSEIDLELRGEGTLMDSRQTGRSDLKLASLRRDRDWVPRARAAAEAISDAGGPDPTLTEEIALLLSDADIDYFDKS
ncbi:MAG: ATP-dependent DNA helicase RecG [Acidimicrobiia bacterium]|nr:ATP-dependent DNA helicase RecG [Acidimicrobiia bacterium]MYB24984.1 ATP-dependent DNA helicase RecG [Acidimicrobiia bacterium]